MSRRRSKSNGSREVRPRTSGLPGWLRVALPAVALVIAVGGVWVLTRGRDTAQAGTPVRLAPVSQLSARVKQAPPVVQEAYRFAIANPDILAQIPCYCGCGGVGHESDLDCFVEEFKADGSVEFSYHAYG